MTSSTAAAADGLGIIDLEVATAHHVLDLAALADARGVDPGKFTRGIGQDEMSVPAADEDAITMGATAASRLLARTGTDGVRTILFATESGVDQSKAAAVVVHGLLELSSKVRAVELKQACYAGTAALQTALGIVARRPAEKVLVIASDVARYALGSAGEPTQGAGAVAMLVGAEPAVLAIEPASGVFTADVDDFWRPNDSTTAIVNSRLSIVAYQKALLGAWQDLQEQGGPGIEEIDALVYHQPFTKMAAKAQKHLAHKLGVPLDEEALVQGAVYNRRLGNVYTASLYTGLVSLLDHREDLVGRRLGLFSYGSGSTGELLTGIVGPAASAPSRRARIQDMLEARVPVTVDQYEALHNGMRDSAEDYETPVTTRAPFRFAGVTDRARNYTRQD
jgi:hydroxymethylglutaryl-CoA synthase